MWRLKMLEPHRQHEHSLEFVKDLLNIVKEESHKRIAKAEEASRIARSNGNLQWYFKGYMHGVEVFLQEFWGRIQQDDRNNASELQQ